LCGSVDTRIEQILAWREEGLSLSEIGRRLGVDHKTIARALRDQGWSKS
jgi:IS30 family transposase